jgi:hypothetical protein
MTSRLLCEAPLVLVLDLISEQASVSLAAQALGASKKSKIIWVWLQASDRELKELEAGRITRGQCKYFARWPDDAAEAEAFCVLFRKARAVFLLNAESEARASFLDREEDLIGPDGKVVYEVDDFAVANPELKEFFHYWPFAHTDDGRRIRVKRRVSVAACGMARVVCVRATPWLQPRGDHYSRRDG